MATVKKKSKVLNVEGKVKVLQETENGKIKETWEGNLSRKFYDKNNLGKGTKMIVCLNKTDRESSAFESPD
jgi:hypothetical protein